MSKKAEHIAIILDGNRRWARERGLPSFEGHIEGRQTVKRCIDWAIEANLKTLTVFAFSTENWKREEDEVNALMGLLAQVLKEDTPEYIEKGVRLKIAGQRERLSEEIQQLVTESEEATKDGDVITLYIAVSYSGRAELLNAAKSLKEFSEEEIREHLWVPVEPDILVRTGGERRISNFLLWQAAYSELFFVDTLWPDFSEEEFKNILKEFETRERRFGK